MVPYNFSTFSVACTSGVCMFSCGEDSSRRQTDLEDLLSVSPCSNLIGSDNLFCGKSPSPCENGTYPKGRDAFSVTRWQNKKQPNFSKVAKNVGTIAFTLKAVLFKMPRQISKYLGYFCYKIGFREVSKIAQCGHTERFQVFALLSSTSLVGDIKQY